jgi:hypothetical protein
MIKFGPFPGSINMSRDYTNKNLHPRDPIFDLYSKIENEVTFQLPLSKKVGEKFKLWNFFLLFFSSSRPLININTALERGHYFEHFSAFPRE